MSLYKLTYASLYREEIFSTPRKYLLCAEKISSLYREDVFSVQRRSLP